MNNFGKGLLSGIIITSLLTFSVASFGSSTLQTIQVALNSVNISVNNSKVGGIGESYVLDNGEKVPYSILYKGTTYLPIRKVAETLGKEVGWNQETRTASINDKKEANSFEPVINNTDSLNDKVNIGETITRDGLSVTIQKIIYSENDEIVDGRPYGKGFSVYYKVINSSDKTYRTPSITYEIDPELYEHELNSMGGGFSMPAGASYYIYPGETREGYFKFIFSHDIKIKELILYMPDSNIRPKDPFGIWYVK